MYKLVVIGGKLRGEEFTLEEGETTLGRDPSCEIPIGVSGVSKRHLRITLKGDNAFLEDLGSSNGTFINGKLVKKAVLKNKDKIAVPDTIIQVVHIKEKKVIVEKQVINDDEEGEEESDYLDGADNVPDHPIGKIVHIFKFKIMSYIHGFNEEYEWRLMFGVILGAYIFATVGLTVSPILSSSKNLLIREIAKRGAHYADEISRLNAKELARGQLGQLNTDFLKNEDGVDSFELFDLQGHIFAPVSLQGEVIKDPFSIQAKDNLLKNHKNRTGKEVVRKFLYDSKDGGMQIGIAQLIFAYNTKIGDREPVGVIAIRFRPASLAKEAAQNSQAFLESLSMAALLAVLFFGIIYFLTIRPLQELRMQIEDVLRGRKKEVEGRLLMEELNPLKNTINNILARIKELSNEESDGDFQEVEDDESYLRVLDEFIEGASGPALTLNSEKLVERINSEAEDLIGLRESSTAGSSLMDTAREKGFAATVTDLCDQSANAEGANQKDTYELGGSEYEINVVSLMGKDGFAKAFYVTFVKD